MRHSGGRGQSAVGRFFNPRNLPGIEELGRVKESKNREMPRTARDQARPNFVKVSSLSNLTAKKEIIILKESLRTEKRGDA